MSKMSLTEATMLALQGKLVENKRPARKLKKENIDINVDDKTNVSVMNNETIVDTEDATIIVDKKEDEFVPETSDGVIDDTSLPIEAPVDTVEIPVEGDETIVPDETIDTSVEEPTETVDVEPDVDLPLETEEPIEDEEKEESKKIESKTIKTKCLRKMEGIRAVEEYEFEFDDLYEIVGSNGKSVLDDIKNAGKEDEFMDYLISIMGEDEDKVPTVGEISDFIDLDFETIYRELDMKTENKKEEKKFKFESKKLQEEITDDVHKAAEEIAKEIEKVGCMGFEDIDVMAADKLGLSLDKLREEQIDTDIYICLNYLGIDNNFGDGDFFTQEYAEKHPEVKEESKEIKKEEIDIEIADDGKSVEVTTDDGEEVTVKDETPDENEEIETEPTEIETPETDEVVEENKKLNEDYSAAPFRDLMYDCMKDDIEPADVMVDRMLSAWSDDDCKWYCETYELVEPYKDFSDEDQYYKDLYGNIRDITGQINEDAELEEAKHRRVESVKKIEARRTKKFENVTRTKKVECDGKTCTGENCKEKTECDEKVECNTITNINESLAKALKVEKIENAKIEEADGKILLKAKVINENKTKGICFVMNTLTENKNFVKYDLHEIKSLKVENKSNTQKFTMLAHKNNNVLECRYIIKK